MTESIYTSDLRDAAVHFARLAVGIIARMPAMGEDWSEYWYPYAVEYRPHALKEPARGYVIIKSLDGRSEYARVDVDIAPSSTAK